MFDERDFEANEQQPMNGQPSPEEQPVSAAEYRVEPQRSSGEYQAEAQPPAMDGQVNEQPQPPLYERPRNMYQADRQVYEQQPMFDPNSYAEQGTHWNEQQYAGWQQPGYQAESQPQPPKKKRKWLHRLIAAAVIVAVLGTAVGVTSIFYEFESNENGFAVVRRGTSTDDDHIKANPTADPDEDYDLYSSPVPTAPDNPLKGEGVGKDGPKMNIDEQPTGSKLDYGDTEGALTPQQVAAKCKQWTVGVVATKYYDSYYYFSGGTATSSGTGIIMSSDGYIITNHHVIEGATALSIVMLDGTEYEATLIGSDEKSDLAVLKIDATGLPAAEFGDSDALLVGDPVYAIGNPLGLELMGTFTDGIVSAINRDVSVDERTMTLIQTNAAINSGNSGGPLINQYGQVIGINTLKMQNYSTTVEGLGFAIPTNTAKVIVDELVEKGYVSGYPAIGLRCDNVSESMSQYYKIPTGVLVRYVNPNANAYFAGLQVNDVIVEAQGERVESYSELSALLQDCKAGDSFRMKVYHYGSGKYEDLEFKLNDENDFQDSTTLTPAETNVTEG